MIRLLNCKFNTYRRIKLTAITLLFLLVLINVFYQQNVNAGNLAYEQIVSRRIIIDMAGREVSVPLEINKIFSINNNGTILTYCLAPEKMIAWNNKVNKNMSKYIINDVLDLPVLGTLYGNSSAKANVEEIIMSNPDIIVFMAPKISQKIISSSDKLEEKLNIPIVIVDGQLSNIVDSVKFFGNLIGEEEKTEKIIDYIATIFEEVNTVSAEITKDKINNVYYARGDNGLTTELNGSLNTETLRLIGAKNVAELDLSANSNSGKGGNYTISKEQLLLWNPDIIIVGDGFYTESELYHSLENDNNWQALNAVKDNQVYFVPNAPFNWFDRPPSLNKIIGIVWAAEIIYPEFYNFDLRGKVKEFYKLFYSYTLSEEELDKLLDCRIK